jgi:two-component system, OmpR family, heavy metal sensor histidine kinase CusS
MVVRNIYSKSSIKGRLVFFLVIAVCIFTYSVFEFTHDNLHTSLSRVENDFLYLRLHAFRAIIQENTNYLDIIRQDIQWEGKYTRFPEYYLRIVDPAEHVLIETLGMEDILPARVASFPNIVDQKHKDEIYHSKNDRFFLLLANSVPVAHESGKKLTLQIALDITSPIKIDEANHKKIIVFLIIEVLLFTGIIVLIVKVGLRPLEDMVKVADQITINTLVENIIPTEKWPREVRKLATSFNSMLERLAVAFSRLSQVTSDMAHEIRTPINNFMGEAEIALSKERSPEEYRDVLASGIEECDRLSRLVNSLLFLAHAEDPTGSINRSLFDPLKEIKDILSFYEPQIEGKRAEVSCCGNGMLNADPLLFRQAVSNLLMNALNYSHDGVKINISIQETKNRYLDVIVTDTGYGIEEKDLTRIFDRFYRIDRANSIHSEGSGLGLSIVRGIMELHGGSILIASRPGEGTTATLRFPFGDIPSSHRS